MKFSRHTFRTILLAVAIASLMLANTALAQRYLRHPLLPPNGCSPACWDPWYVEAGVKMRNINTLEFQRVPHVVARGDAPAVPFGPLGDALFNPGPFAIRYPPTPEEGNPNLNLSGVWTYDNGLINPFGGDTDWTSATASGGGLGHDGVTGTDWGLFVINDPLTQPNNAPGAVNQTQFITWSLTLDGDLPPPLPPQDATVLASAAIYDSATVKLSERIWTPYIEWGYQRSNFFDWFCAISWFSLTKSDLHRTDDVEVTVGYNQINDIFPFASDESDDWSAAPVPVVSNVAFTTSSGFIFPAAGGLRIFSIAPIALPEGLEFSETLFNKIDLTMVEFTFGGRSWYPIYNWGKLGFASGPLFALIPYTLLTTQTLESNIPIPPDDELFVLPIAHKQDDTWWDIGWFGALDMELHYGPVYGKGSVGYDIYFRNLNYTGVAGVETRFNPSGWTLAFAGGVNF